MKNNEHLKSVYSRYLANLCSEEEKLLLFRHFRTSDEQELLSLIHHELNRAEGNEEPTYKERIKLDRLRHQIHERIADRQEISEQDVFKFRCWNFTKYQVAATICLFLGLGVGYYLLNRSDFVQKKNEPLVYASIHNPKAKIFLRLYNGEVIQLNEEKGGIRILEHQVVYRDGTKIIDQLPSSVLELIVKKGGQYQVNLADGSDVWLNASSRLRVYPDFAKTARMIDLEGEAFFSIEKAAGRRTILPFVVRTGTQKIEVLGTKFNVSAYHDEVAAKTTLLEGKVKVTAPGANKTTFLKPNQEAVVQQRSLIIQEADTAKALAWKNGYFKFNGDRIQDIMLKISRWYDVEVTYVGTITSEEFVGMISFKEDLSQVLEKLSLTGNLQFKLENGRIIVSSKK